VFPIYSALKVKNTASYMRMSKLGLMLTGVIYFSVATVSILMFGTEIESSVLLNIGQESQDNSLPKGSTKFWEAYIVQISFMIVIACHIPFIFFSGKEGLCILIDELDRKSISSALWHKLQANTQFAEESKEELPPNPELPCPGESDVSQRFETLTKPGDSNGNKAGAMEPNMTP